MMTGTKAAAFEAASQIRIKPIFTMMVMLCTYLIWAGLPARIWLDVRSVTVSDAFEGEAPRMIVERYINRDFDGLWQVELEKRGSRGFVQIDKATGGGHYRPDAELPHDLDLDWWTRPKEFRPLPGRYRIETCWTIIQTWIQNRTTCVISNTFTVRPKANHSS